MNRMVISLEDSDKFWLAKESKTQKKSIAQIIRDALHDYRKYFIQNSLKTLRIFLRKLVGSGNIPKMLLIIS